MSIDLFEHNQNAFNNVEAMLLESNRVAVVHPTGTGKSFIAFKMAEKHKDKSFVWLSPSVHIYNNQIFNLQKSCGYVELNNITFSTYEGLIKKTREELSQYKADYIVLDEFHRCGAVCWGGAVTELIDLHPSAKVVGLSATNIRYLDDNRDIAAELFDNNIASYMSLGEALTRGILKAPKYVVSMYNYDSDLQKYHKWIDGLRNSGYKSYARGYFDKLKNHICTSTGLKSVFGKHIKKKNGKYIAFCSGINHMEEIVGNAYDWFAEIDDNPTFYCVYSGVGRKENMAMLDEFRMDNSNHLKVLFCIDMLNEGVHVNDIDGVILFRPTISPIIYRQQIGRAFSVIKSDSPIVFDIVNNFENIDSIATVKAEMKEAKEKLRRKGESEKIKIEDFEIIDETRECRSLFIAMDRILSSSWDVYYEAAKEYYEKNGNLKIPCKYKTKEGLSLGEWISSQRRKNNKDYRVQLTDEQRKKLDNIHMIWDVNNDKWEKFYEAAGHYYNEHGNLSIPYNYVTSDGVKLGQLLVYYRQLKNGTAKGKSLTQEKIHMLESIGINWKPSDSDSIWEFNFTEVMHYYKKYHTADIAFEYVNENNIYIGRWLCAQRVKFKKGLLDDKKVEKLRSIGALENKSELAWNTAYEAARKYYTKHGDLRIPEGYETESGLILSKWLTRQRKKYNDGELDDNKIHLLEEIGINWNVQESLWNKSYDKLNALYNEIGDANFSAKYRTQDGECLGAWLAKQRKKYRNGKLTEKQIEDLEKIGVSVTFPKEISALKNGSKPELTVAKTKIEEAGSKGFTVTKESNVALSALDLTLVVNGETISNFTDSEGSSVDVPVTTYVAKGITDFGLNYNGEAFTVVENKSEVDAAGKVWYDSETGKLLFKTNHFSNYVIEGSNQAYVKETNTAYDTIENAVKAAEVKEENIERYTISLLRNIDLTKYTANGTNAEIELVLTNDTLDLNNYKIVSKNHAIDFMGDNVIIQNGTFEVAESGSYALCFDQSTATLKNISTIGGINVHGSTVDIYNCSCNEAKGTNYYALWADIYGVINVYSGKYSSPSTCGGCVLNTSKDGKIIIKGGEFEALGTAKMFSDSTHETIVLEGGTYNKEISSSEVCEPYVVKENENNTWTVYSDAKYKVTWSAEEYVSIANKTNLDAAINEKPDNVYINPNGLSSTLESKYIVYTSEEIVGWGCNPAQVYQAYGSMWVAAACPKMWFTKSNVTHNEYFKTETEADECVGKHPGATKEAI